MEILKFIEKLSNNQKILVIGFIAALFLIAWFNFISKVETKINNASEANNGSDLTTDKVFWDVD